MVKYSLFLLVLSPLPALAYMGPGAGITAIGCLIALLAGLWYTLKGFLWLPLKRLVGLGKDTEEVIQQASAQDRSQDPTSEPNRPKLEDQK